MLRRSERDMIASATDPSESPWGGDYDDAPPRARYVVYTLARAAAAAEADDPDQGEGDTDKTA